MGRSGGPSPHHFNDTMSGYSTTPTPELFAKCYEQAERQVQSGFSIKFAMSHAIRTAHDTGHAAGADQELEACCEWLSREIGDGWGLSAQLRAVRRPQPVVAEKLHKDRPWSEYPIGTKAYAVMGGHWIRVEHGWKWCCGDTFPTPGGDACGRCIELPAEEVQS